MYGLFCNQLPIRNTFVRSAVDTCVVGFIKYRGSQVAAHVSVAATTGDMTFEQGATTAAADVSTGTNPGTSGVIDISDLSTVWDLKIAIDNVDWEFILRDYRGDNDIEVTAGNAIFITTLTDKDCTVDGGYAIVGDTSLETAEIFPVGVTLNAQSSDIKNSDRLVTHEVISVVATVTYGGATGGINVYECNDEDGTSTLLNNMALVSATATTFENNGEPLYQVRGRRIVFEAVDASGAITVPSISISDRAWISGPTSHPDRDLSRQ